MTYIGASPWFLIALGLAGAYCIVGLSIRNGLFGLQAAQAAAYPTRMPGFDADDTLRTSYTGHAGFDEYIVGLVRVFAALGSGQHQPLSLFSFWFSGQALAGLVIMTLDGLRAGNRGKAISYTSVWGMVYQNVPYGFVVPLYVATWLWTSPIAYLSVPATPPAEAAALLVIDDADLSVLPHSLIWGYILPTVLACLPAPAVVSREQKTNYLVIFQVFPAMVSLAQLILSSAARRARPAPGTEAAAKAAPDGQKKASANRLRWIYVFTIGIVAAVHIASVLYAVAPALRPQSLAPLDPASVNLANTFKPVLTPFEAVRPTKSIEDGLLQLLQYDCYFAGVAFLYWASCQFRAATEAPTLSSVLILLAGPMGAALILMWRRDEQMLLKDATKVKTK